MLKLNAFLFLATSFVFLTKQVNACTELRININKNLELISIIGGLTESGQDIWETYEPQSYAILGNRAKEHFLPYQEHPAVTFMQQLFDNAIGLSTLPFLALNFEAFPTSTIPRQIDVKWLDSFAPGGTDDEAWAALDSFRIIVNDFYHKSNFEAWFLAQQPIYQKILVEIETAIPEGFISAMVQFYGEKHLSYNLIPAVHFPPTMGFGPHIMEGDQKHIYNIFAPLGPQVIEEERFVQLGYGYPKKLLQICLHEFGHSFVNPYVLTDEAKAIFKTYQHLYRPIATAMNEQAYENWTSAIVEHIVRAGEIRVFDLLGLYDLRDHYKDYHQVDRSFIYLPQILKQFEYYEQNRDQFPTFASFVPTMLKKIAPTSNSFDSIPRVLQSLKGYIIDASTNQPIEYATAGLIGTSIGAISDQEGRFTLDLQDAQLEDTLRIAYLGYEPFRIRLGSVVPEKEMTIKLNKKTFKLPEVIVRKQLPKLIVGNQRKTRFFTGWGYDGVMRGASRGLIITVEDGPVRLQKFSSNIARMGFDSILFRLRIYRMKGDQPMEDVLPENVFIPVHKKGALTYSFVDQNYWLDNGRYLVALEWIDTWGDGHGLLTISMSDQGILYYRNSTEDLWEKSTSKGPFINLEVGTIQ